MNKKRIYICWSPASDAGKDTVADILNELHGVTKVKFSRAFKTPLEQWLGLQYGDLDNKDIRVRKVINPVTEVEESFTYNELMYNFFHEFPKLYFGNNYLVPGATKQTIFSISGDCAIVDLRNRTELELVKLLQSKYNYEFILLHITGRGVQQSTDKDIVVNDFSFVNYQFDIVNTNDVTIDMLRQQLIACLNNGTY